MLPSPEPGEGRDVHEQPHVTHCRCHHSSTNAVTKALSCADCTFSLSVVRPICSLVPLSHPTPWNVNNNQYIPPLLLCYVHFSKGCPEIVLFLARSSWNEQDFHKPCTQWVGANCIQPADHLLAHVNCLFFFSPPKYWFVVILLKQKLCPHVIHHPELKWIFKKKLMFLPSNFHLT